MTENIIGFLIRAKRATYAGKGAETDSSRPCSHDLEYAEGDFLYYDSYLGGSNFAGEEALWINKMPYWCMNYAGRVVGENFSGDFLKMALLEVPFEKPFREPEIFTYGDYVYKCFVEGDFEWFQGREVITYKSAEIYECFFHGGLIK